MASIAANPPRTRTREPTTVVWREQAIAEITQMELAVDWLSSPVHGTPRLDADTAQRIHACLADARRAAVGEGLSPRRRLMSWLHGASVERAWGHIDAAGEMLMRAASPEYVVGQLPRVERRADRALRCDDARRVHLHDVAKRFAPPT